MFNKSDIRRNEFQLFGKQGKKDMTGGGILLLLSIAKQEKRNHFISNSFYAIQN